MNKLTDSIKADPDKMAIYINSAPEKRSKATNSWAYTYNFDEYRSFSRRYVFFSDFDKWQIFLYNSVKAFITYV